MLKTFKHGFFVLGIYFKANGIWAFFDITDRFYTFSFFPLIQTVLLARLIDILSRGQSLTFSDVSVLGQCYIVALLFQGIIFCYTPRK
jgi:hypothetical protein